MRFIPTLFTLSLCFVALAPIASAADPISPVRDLLWGMDNVCEDRPDGSNVCHPASYDPHGEVCLGSGSWASCYDYDTNDDRCFDETEFVGCYRL